MKIGVIGGGFVGSAVAQGFSQAHDVDIFDVQPKKSTANWDSIMKESEIIFICIPTPSDDAGIDLSIMDELFSDINKAERHPEQIILVKSTVIPGTVVRYSLAYPDLVIMSNPEFLTERTAKLDFINPSRIVIGYNNVHKNKIYIIANAYQSALSNDIPIIWTYPTAAELGKYACNCFFAMKISFMNELRQIFDELLPQLDSTQPLWRDVISIMVASGRIAPSHLNVPGPDGKLGYGGACFPKDIKALIGLAKEFYIDPKLLKATEAKNKEVRGDRGDDRATEN